MKSNEKQWNAMKSNEKQWKAIKNNETKWKKMKSKEKQIQILKTIEKLWIHDFDCTLFLSPFSVLIECRYNELNRIGLYTTPSKPIKKY